MSFTTTFSLWSTLVTNTCGTSSLLRSWLGTRPSRVSQCLGSLPDGLTLVFKILVDTVHDVSSQNLVEVLLVQGGHFTCELACDEVENGHI